MDLGHLVDQGTPGELLARHRAEGLEEVFATVTGRLAPQPEHGRLSDVRARRGVARRLG
jgi:hypothetical protein